MRNWRDDDRAQFHRINVDDQVMAFFPMRSSRAESDALLDRIIADIEKDGFGWTAVEVAASGLCAGFVGLNVSDNPGILPEGAMEIGWRLAPEHWGQGYATEAASALLDHAFGALGRERVYCFAVVENRPSIAVMLRLGMVARGEFDHPLIPDSHPHLRRHVLYAIDRSDWIARR